MTTTALPDTRTDLEVIEALDFEHTPGCEHSRHSRGVFGHSGPAWALVRVSRACCTGESTSIYLCKGAWVVAFETGLTCSLCGMTSPRDNIWTILAYVNGSR